jgi:perosamine synthetase
MIPVSEPMLTEQDVELVLDCLRSGWISSAGKYLDEFEAGWAAYCGMKHGIAVSHGTTALEIAARLLDLQPGEEVIMPTFTIISCALAVVRCGGTPVLVDSDARTWQMDTDQVERKITPRTRAIMVVHIYGHPADMDPLLDLAARHNLVVIEDAAEAHGAQYRGRMCGGLGDISIFSFYANKLITTGEGGMVLTQRDDLAERARSLSNLCFQRSRRFLHDELGYNFRLTNMQAALGVAQVRRIDRIVEGKRAIAHAYSQRLRDVPGLALPVEEPWARSVYWVYGIVLDDASPNASARGGLDADVMARRLREKGVETRPFFLGMHEQPAFHRLGLFRDESYPVAERLARQGLYLPSGLTITEAEIDLVCDAVRACLT